MIIWLVGFSDTANLSILYRGGVNPCVKGSVHVLFWNLHSRGVRGRKGRECKFQNVAHRAFDLRSNSTPVYLKVTHLLVQVGTSGASVPSTSLTNVSLQVFPASPSASFTYILARPPGETTCAGEVFREQYYPLFCPLQYSFNFLLFSFPFNK